MCLENENIISTIVEGELIWGSLTCGSSLYQNNIPMLNFNLNLALNFMSDNVDLMESAPGRQFHDFRKEL